MTVIASQGATTDGTETMPNTAQDWGRTQAETDQRQAERDAEDRDLAMAAQADGIETAIRIIAQDKLGLETLETRNSDSLDFSDQAVWNLEAALRAAYRAGQLAGKS